jgi:2-phosphosulfolactate phosphatase
VDGFDFGNSPFSFMREELIGKTIVLTTTNCTTAIAEASRAKQILIGSFINHRALVDHLRSIKNDIIILCAGWRNNFNLEDTIFSGSLVAELMDMFTVECDSAIAAYTLFTHTKSDISLFLKNSSHARRLKHLDLSEDVKYCLTPNLANCIPEYVDGVIRKMGLVDA